MKLDLTSFAFGFAINGSNGNPNWATALGQGYLHKINQSDSINEILKGLIYCSVPLDRVQTKIGKGGKVYKGTDPESGIVTGSVFNKVYVNGNLVPDCKVIIVLTKDTTRSHEGRLRLKYSPHNAILNEQGDVAFSNADQIEKIRAALNLKPKACWFVYEIEVVGQDSLYLSAGIANPSANVSYASTSDLHDKWNDIIVAAGGSPIETLTDNGVYQLITYGAPGTGKSHNIDKRTNESNSIRVTFHPDTDYAAFVGAYKPTMESSDKGLLTLQELGTVLQSLKDRGETRPEQKLGAEFWRSFEKLTPAEVKSILENDSMYAEVMKGVAVGEYLTRIENGGKQIVYAFVPQAFMKAYVEAWRRYTNAELQDDAKTYYLVIEEINRGNCAQIFGDLFQLLDRADNGFSAYAITPDDDIQKFLETDKDYKLSDIPLTVDIKKTSEDGEKVIATAADIKSGKKLVLPPNLCIWATMNTSDQSLFPIDSAFKRRWEWEYVPIEDVNKNWKIDVGGVKYKWWSFLEKINYLIATETSSEDKQLGYFFVKAKDTMIDAETFVSKVVFFLWGDVFKDNLPDEDVFKYTFKKDGKDDKRLIRFADFYHPEPGNTKEEWRNKLLTSFLEALKVEKEPPADNDSGQGSSNANGDDAKADE